MNWLDIVILVVIVFAAVRGSIVGMIKSLIGLFALIVAFFTANIFNDDLAKLIIGQTNIKNSLQIFFEKDLFNKLSIPKIDLPEIKTDGFGEIGDYLNSILSNSDIFKAYSFSSVGEFIANAVISFFSWIVIFIIAYIAVRILGIIVEEIFKLPILKTINGIGGFAIGLIKGSLFVFLFVLGLKFIGEISSGTYLTEIINESYFVYYIFKYNILRWIIV